MGSTLSLEGQRRRFGMAVPLAAALVFLFGVFLSPGMSQDTREIASAAGLLTAGTVSAISFHLRAGKSTGRRRRAWRFFTAAALAAIAGNVVVALTGSRGAQDLSIAIALALSIMGVVSFPSARRRGQDLAVMVLDGIVMGAAVLIMAAVLVYSELLVGNDEPFTDRASTLIIPFLDIVLVTVGLLLVLRSRGRGRPALTMVAAGFMLYAVADLVYAVRVAEDTFAYGTWSDLGWIAGYLIIGLAAWYPVPPDEGQDDDFEQATAAGTPDTVFVFAVLLAAVAVQAFFGDPGDMQRAHGILWVLLAAAAGTRQVLLTSDNARLRRGLERRVEEQTADIRRLARQTQVLLTSVGDGIYGVDNQGRVTFVNPSGAEALGFGPEELLGVDAHAVFHAPTVDGAPYPYQGCYIAEAISDRVLTNAEEDTYLRSDGSSFPVEISASPLVDDSAVLGAVVVFRDVTQRREVDRMKNEFLSVVSHELRTPLTSIRGSLSLLSAGQLGELTPRATSIARVALESSERLTRLINDILDLERVESGTQPMALSPVAAEDLVGAAVAEMGTMARGAGVVLSAGSTTGTVLADRDRIVQTLANLVNNAVKFSATGGTVLVDTEVRNGEVLFRVTDEGRGIPAEQVGTIFERFHQVDSSDARQKGGTGLGLAISRGIVERHGGRIWAESRLGRGTTVKFTLPAPRRQAPSEEGTP